MEKVEKNNSEYIIFYLKGYGNPVPGAESAGYNILKSIINRSDFKIIIISDQKAKKTNDEILYRHKILPINIPILNFIINNFFASRIIKKLSQIYAPKLIHIQGYAGYYPIISSNSKTLLTLHDDPSIMIFDKARRDPLKYFEFFWYEFIRFSIFKAIKNYDFFQAGSSRIKNYLTKLGISKKRIYLIPNGIYKYRIFNNKKKVFKERLNDRNKRKIKFILVVGSIEHRKGTLNVALSLKYLPRKFHLLVVGNPQAIIGLSYLKKVLNVDRDRIHYLGYLKNNDYFSVLDEADIYISASISEACQLAPLEALMMEKKVIITPVGAIPDFFPLNYPLLIKKNNPREIANVILKASRTEKIKELNGKLSPETWEEIGKDLKKMYSNIISIK